MAGVPRLPFLDAYVLMMVAAVWAIALARRPQARAWVQRIPWFALGIQLVVTALGLFAVTRAGGDPEQAARLLDGVQLASTLGVAGCLLADLVGTVQAFAAPRPP